MWLITGGSGQLGTALSAFLDIAEIKFQALSSSELDIRSMDQIMKAVEQLKPTVIINAAAWTDVDGAESDPEGAYAVNTVGTRNLAIAAKSCGATFVQVSTDYIFSGDAKTPWQEGDLPSPLSVYGKSKADGEAAVLAEYPEGSYIFRTAWLYSCWGGNFVKTMTRLALSNSQQVQVVEDQVGQPTSASDLAAQIAYTVLAQLPFGIYHGTNAGQATWFEFAQEIFTLCGASSSSVVAIKSEYFIRPAKRPMYSVLGHEAWKLVGRTGVSINPMRDWRIALKESMPAIISAVKAGV